MAYTMEKGTGFRLNKIYRNEGRYYMGHRLPKDAENVLAGKTGTAQTGKNQEDHAWFLGIAPWKKPRYAIVVVVEHGGLGAKTAGPIAVKVMHAALNRESEDQL